MLGVVWGWCGGGGGGGVAPANDHTSLSGFPAAAGGEYEGEQSRQQYRSIHASHCGTRKLGRLELDKAGQRCLRDLSWVVVLLHESPARKTHLGETSAVGRDRPKIVD